MTNGIALSLHKNAWACELLRISGMTVETSGGDESPTPEQMKANVVRLAFGGSEERFDDFVRLIREDAPPGTAAVLRGSAITGYRWRDGAPFDADGPGTSDLDVTLVGKEVVSLFNLSGFFVPGVHSRPISDDEPGLAPELMALREALTVMAGRPVNLQASREIVIRFRGDLLGQPYLTLIAPPERS
jgi:hypothetical protein